MSYKVAFLALSVLLVFHDIDGKKVRKKRPQAEEEPAFPQPNVLTYSNFGVNDVGSYDGFVPSSPDYATLISSNGGKEDSTTRLYGPAFPTAMESSGLSTGFGSQLSDGQSYNTGSEGQQLGLFHLEPNTMHTFSLTSGDAVSENRFSGPDASSSQNSFHYGLPVYGAKLNMKGKAKPYTEFLETNFKEITTETPTTHSHSNEKNNEKYLKTRKRQHPYESKQTTTESSSHHSMFNNIPNYPTTALEPFMKMSYNHSSNHLNFPRVVDFTNIKPLYQNDMEGNYPKVNVKPFNNVNSDSSYNPSQNNYNNDHDDKYFKVSTSLKNSLDYKGDNDKKGSKLHTNIKDSLPSSSSNKYKGSVSEVDYKDKYKFKGTVSDVEFKDKLKEKPWKSNNEGSPAVNNNEVAFSSSKFINYNDDPKSNHAMNGYQYSTNHSSTSFKYDFEEPKKEFNSNIDEIVPASSNIDSLDYHHPDIDFGNLDEIPNFNSHLSGLSDLSFNYQNHYKAPDEYKSSEEYLNRFKNLYTTTPTSTSNWGNLFKPTDYSLDKHHNRRPQFDDENINHEIVHIPKRPQYPKFGKYDFKTEDKPSEFQFYSNYRPYKQPRPQFNWNKEKTNTRYKSEEDLLGLRTRDSLRPSYLPTFGSTHNDFSEDNEFKNLVDKWRSDYLKAKQKEAFHDYESYASDSNPIHVPLPKPYPIEVPHPVIVPVPQPYPVRVPVPRPVAVPVVQELRVPIEKPVPYPVIKKVPYPIEKPVPVPVQKQVQVPVVKPYPVPIPQIRPVFHHSKHRDEYNNLDHDEEDYEQRPESSKRVPYAKRPKSSRNRQRRPSRTAYPERSRRRWPQQAAQTKDRRPSRRPPPPSMDSSYPHHRHRDRESEDAENEDRYTYCKKSGDC